MAQNHSSVTLKVAIYPLWTGNYFKMCFRAWQKFSKSKGSHVFTRYTPLLNAYWWYLVGLHHYGSQPFNYYAIFDYVYPGAIIHGCIMHGYIMMPWWHNFRSGRWLNRVAITLPLTMHPQNIRIHIRTKFNTCSELCSHCIIYTWWWATSNAGEREGGGRWSEEGRGRYYSHILCVYAYMHMYYYI